MTDEKLTKEGVRKLWTDIQNINLSVGLEQETLDDCRKATAKQYTIAINNESKGDWVRNSMDIHYCKVCQESEVLNPRCQCKCDET